MVEQSGRGRTYGGANTGGMHRARGDRVCLVSPCGRGPHRGRTTGRVSEGVREVYRVERDSLCVGRTSAHVHALDAHRTTASEELSRMIATCLVEIVRDYTHELGALREELGAERARREMAEATLREGMAEEQRRREEAERERDELRQELHALRVREPRESPEMGEEQQGRGQPHSDAPDAQEGVQRPWWRRVLGR